ncbi:MAG: Uncharacterised protein [Cyanobium sp. ARS6]|nr:MAG: Uncharacterised protein [Cyanobium sp. ARS6]
MAVKRWLETGFIRRHTQKTQQWCVVHPVESRFARAAVDGVSPGGKNEHVALAPLEVFATGFSVSLAIGHEEQLACCHSCGAQPFAIQSDEVGAQRWTGGRSTALQFFAQIQRHHSTAFLGKESRGKGAIGNSTRQSAANRIGRFAVGEITSLSR